MSTDCIKCNGEVKDNFRLIWSARQKDYLRLCARCSRGLENLVVQKGPIGLLSVDNPRFMLWVEDDAFLTEAEYLSGEFTRDG